MGRRRGTGLLVVLVLVLVLGSLGAAATPDLQAAPTDQATDGGTAKSPGSVAGAPEKTPASAALDFNSLEQRLRDTHAIGVFTKLSLKNEVDDLLDAFRAYYSGQSKTTLADLRQRFELLLLKALTLLQDGDPALASDISTSREAIWGVLADAQQFHKSFG